MSNTTETQARAEAALKSELTGFVSKLIEGAVAAGSDPATCKFEPQEGVLQIGESQLVVASLYTLFTEQVNDKARQTFIENVIKTATGKANMPAALDQAAGILMPQIYGEQKIREKQANLGKAAVLPYQCLDGSDRLLVAGDVAVCVVADFGHATVPVLSSTLKQWDCSFTQVLEVAVANLVAKNEKLVTANSATEVKGKGKGKKSKGKKAKSVCSWDTHPSGCDSTGWHDQYDSTRAALIPHFVQTRGVDPKVGPQGDTVTLFGANQQCLVSGAINPIGLCFMGDMCLDIAKTRDLISNQPHRLTVQSLKTSKMPAANPSHPFHKVLTSGLGNNAEGIYTWERYEPAKGEFSVPEEQGEVDAILAAVQSGKQIPVFRRESAGSTAPATINPNADWVKFKDKGTEFFKKKDFTQAEQWYTKAIDAHTKEETDEKDNRGAIFSNRSAARIGLDNPSGALSDAEQVIVLRPHWPKGYFRQAKALELLRRYNESSDAFARAAAATMANAPSKKSKEAKEAARLQAQAVGAKGCSERHCAMIGATPKPTRAKVRQLLSEALGWADGMKSGGDDSGAVPGWMPVNVQDTAAARLAATTLYSMLRDRRVTERDRKSEPCSSYCYSYENSTSDTESKDANAECSSPRRPAAPPNKVRGIVLRELAEAGGERTMIVMVMGMQAAGTASTDGTAAFGTPLEKRSLLQLVQSILEIAELKAATVQFMKLMGEDEEASKLLGDAMKAPEPAPKAAPKVVKKEAAKETKEPPAVPVQPRKNSKKENCPAGDCCSSNTTKKTETKAKPTKKAAPAKKAKPATTITLDSSTLASLGSGFGQTSWKGASSNKNSEFVVGASTLGSSSTFSPNVGSSSNQRGLL